MLWRIGAIVGSPVIDAHMHLFTRFSPEFPRGLHELYPADRTAEIEEYLAFAERNDVAHSVLVSLDENDEYTAHALAQHPGRFSAVAVMDVNAADPVDDLSARVDTMPLVGFRVWTLGAGQDLQVPDRYLALLDELQRRGIAAWFYSDELQLRALAQVVERFPDLTVVLNHLGFCQSGFACDEWGRPRISTQIPPASFAITEDLARHPNVAVLFSGHYAFSQQEYPYDDMRVVSHRLLEAFGPTRLMWASDWPWIKDQPGYRELIDLASIHLAELNEHEMDMVLGGNAARILGIDMRSD